MTTAAVITIKEDLKAKIAAIVPWVREGQSFRCQQITEALDQEVKDAGFERSFRVLPGTPLKVHDFGATEHEVRSTFQLQFGYLGHQDDEVLQDQVSSDMEQVFKALQAYGLTWPSALSNLYPAGDWEYRQVGQGNNVVVVVWSWVITYDV